MIKGTRRARRAKRKKEKAGCPGTKSAVPSSFPQHY